MKLSIIIPAYNEERTIGEVIRQVNAVSLGNISREIIVVDDGSKDNTSKIVKNLASSNKNLIFLQHRKNHGKGAAVQTGIKKASGDIILIQDADFEYNPEDIPQLVKPIVDGKALVVYGTRLKVKPILFGKNRTPHLHHFFGNKFLSFVTSLLYGYSVSDMETGYKVFDKKVLEGIRLEAKSFDFEPEITAKMLKRKIHIVEIEIKTKPRSYEEGKKIHWFSDGLMALWTLFKYTFKD